MRTPPLRLLTFVGLCFSLLGCGATPMAKAKPDAQEDFCSGSSPKAVVNGVAAMPKVTGKVELTMECCQGASFTVSSPPFDYKVKMVWGVQFGHEDFPARVDLAHPEQGWLSWIELSCSSGEFCSSSPDAYDSGMQGWLEVSRVRADDLASGYHMGICMRVAEAPESPHALLHSFELFAPDITAPPSR